MSDGSFAPRSMKRRNVKGLALAAPKPPPTSSAGSMAAPSLRAGDSQPDDVANEAQLDIKMQFNLDIRPEDLEIVRELGSGNGGTVSKVKHQPTGTMMARKVIHVEANKELRRRIVRELQIMHGCKDEHIVTFYGAFLNDHKDVIMCMEYMDVGSLDRVSRVFGPVRVDVLGKIAVATLEGLDYLYRKFKIMHRDIKPSNILINSKGDIKLCDFGVSGELVNSIADTFVGTSTYMAPERIKGEKYTVKSDVWSFGLTIMELAIGKFPFAASDQVSDGGDNGPAGILDLLQQIVNEEAPKLPKSDAFPSILEEMIQKCLEKNPKNRPTPQVLLRGEPGPDGEPGKKGDAFIEAAKRTPVDLRAWAVSLMEKDNRKSHLAPQLSPATQELLRSSDSPSLPTETSSLYTPTYGEIPIVGEVASPRDHYGQVASRSPTRNGAGSLGRSGGTSVHPGLGQRSATSSSIPKVSTPDMSHPASAGVGTFTLPVRPAPPGGPLPPPPPRKATPDEMRSDTWRTGAYAPASNGNYGAMGYPRK
ncbi:kinase-like domain-containing protein [Xylariaceae sp. FL0255]|nr:kinase-like domain-containing protein [Xylariaceae sp. FL0255]